MGRKRTIRVEIDLDEISTDDLVEELQKRAEEGQKDASLALNPNLEYQSDDQLWIALQHQTMQADASDELKELVRRRFGSIE